MKLENSIKPLIVYEEGDYSKIINFLYQEKTKFKYKNLFNNSKMKKISVIVFQILMKKKMILIKNLNKQLKM